MTRNLFTLSAVLLASLTLPAAQGKTKEAGDHAKETLKDVESLAIAAADKADTLNMFINGGKETKESHAAELTALKETVNHMGQDIVKLDGERGSLSDWEQQALDRVLPLIQAAAKDTSQAIVYFNNNPSHLWGPEDAGYAGRIYQESDKVANTLKSYLKYEKLREEESALETQISTGMND